jgi:hypothetical protein
VKQALTKRKKRIKRIGLKMDRETKIYLVGILALPYLYYPKGDGYIIISCGPDRDYDIDPEKYYDPNIAQPSLALLTEAGTYDPTNGHISDGDIFRVKQ